LVIEIYLSIFFWYFIKHPIKASFSAPHFDIPFFGRHRLLLLWLIVFVALLAGGGIKWLISPVPLTSLL